MLITKQGLDKLINEINLLKTKLPFAIERLAKAREQGDLSENSEYAAAREELDNLNSRINELQHHINQAQVANNNNHEISSLGSVVIVEVNGVKKEFTLVGSVESDPLKGKISVESPVGKALLGKKAGDVVNLNGNVNAIYKIIEIK